MISLQQFKEGRLWRTTEATVHLVSQTQAEQRAAAFSYYALFSIFPLIALLLTLGSLFFSPDEVAHTIARIAPLGPAQENLIWQMVDSLQRARGGIGIASAFVFLWASLRFFQSLVRGIHRAWHPDELSWLKTRLKNLIMIAALAGALMIGLLAPVLMQGFRNAVRALDSFLLQHFPDLQLEKYFPALDAGRYVLGTLVLFYAISMLYLLAPRRKIRFRQIWPVIVLITILVQVSQNVFVNYLPHIINYNAIYGTVGGVMFLLLWIYVVGLIILAGGCLCAAKVQVWDGERIESIEDNGV